jgi:hypothetical protein
VCGGVWKWVFGVGVEGSGRESGFGDKAGWRNRDGGVGRKHVENYGGIEDG